jgi:hypothetical protein
MKKFIATVVLLLIIAGIILLAVYDDFFWISLLSLVAVMGTPIMCWVYSEGSF